MSRSMDPIDASELERRRIRNLLGLVAGLSAIIASIVLIVVGLATGNRALGAVGGVGLVTALFAFSRNMLGK